MSFLTNLFKTKRQRFLEMANESLDEAGKFSKKERKKIAEEIKLNANEKYNGKVITNISKQKNYCKAEEYHQKYIQKKGL